MSFDPLTIISALVAIFVIWKLRSVLGERTGLEKPPTNPFLDRERRADGPPGNPQGPPQGQPNGGPPPRDSVVRLPGAVQPPAASPNRWASYAEPGSPVAAGLDAIAAAAPAFSPGPFLEGAQIAYEAVITAFAAGERNSLRNLLANEVYDSFAAAIAAREARHETLTTTFVSMEDAKIETAALEGRMARIGVRFTSKQISVTHDSDGTLTDGSTDRAVDMNDVWTFARDTSSRDPNWKLVATQSGR